LFDTVYAIPFYLYINLVISKQCEETKPPVISVQRLERCGEHSNDRQLDIVNAMAEEGKIMAVYDIDELEDALRNVGENPVRIGSERMRLVNALKKYLGELDAKD
jgi:UDP-N-acetylglucosamine transferase subunit ALG13